MCSSRPFFGITEIEGGLPHSEILGSKLVRSSPRLIAAYHVLHRLSAPRHPPNALMTLDCSHYRRPPPLPLGRGKSQSPFLEISERHGQSIEKTIFASNTPESAAVKPRPLQEIAQESISKTPIVIQKAEASWRQTRPDRSRSDVFPLHNVR